MDDSGPACLYAMGMLDYAQEHALEVLKDAHTAILATNGPAGLQMSRHPCQAAGLDLYLLVPQTSDHLFNLEHDPSMALLAEGWRLKGVGEVVPTGSICLDPDLLNVHNAEWCVLIRVIVRQIHVLRGNGWGDLETIDLNS